MAQQILIISQNYKGVSINQLLMEDCSWNCTSPPKKVVDKARLNKQAFPVSKVCEGKEKSAQNCCKLEKAIEPKG